MADKPEALRGSDEQAREAALKAMRARFAAATPPTRPRKVLREPVDWRRSGKALVLILILLAAMLLAGFAHAGPVLERLQEKRLIQLETGLGVRILRDVAYGSDPRQRMDVYLPEGAQHVPVIFMVHGGGWRTGDKRMGRAVENKARRWLPQGFAFISVNYRMLPDADPLTQAEDVARALAFAQTHAAANGADPEAFVLMGHSAGAHLVSLLNAGPQRAFRLGARPWLGAVALDTAAMDIPAIMQRPHMRLYDDAFGKDPAFWRAVSPLHQLTAGGSPLLAVCSSTRPDKPCAGTHLFAQKAAQLGLRVDVHEEARGHGEINEDLGLPGTYTEAVDAFIAGLSPALRARLAP